MQKVNVKINDDLVTYNTVITGITYNQKIYYSMDMLAENLKIHYKTVQRRITKWKKKDIEISDYLISVDNKNYVSRLIFPEYKTETNTSKKKISKEQIRREKIQMEYVKQYDKYNWDFFAALHFETLKYQDSAELFIEKFNKEIKKKVSEPLGVKHQLLFTIEKNKISNGFHLHFLIEIDNKDLKNEFKVSLDNLIDKYTGIFNCKVELFNPKEKGVEYIFKQAYRNNFRHGLL